MDNLNQNMVGMALGLITRTRAWPHSRNHSFDDERLRLKMTDALGGAAQEAGPAAADDAPPTAEALHDGRARGSGPAFALFSLVAGFWTTRCGLLASLERPFFAS